MWKTLQAISLGRQADRQEQVLGGNAGQKARQSGRQAGTKVQVLQDNTSRGSLALNKPRPPVSPVREHFSSFPLGFVRFPYNYAVEIHLLLEHVLKCHQYPVI